MDAYAGILGTSGFTAYAGVFGMFDLQPDECFVVSAAGGAVGTAAGEFAKLRGARVIGIAGGKDKCRTLIDRLGFDAAVDYKADLGGGLDTVCPDGIDFYFENVGGEVQREVFARMRNNGRIAMCGQVAQYTGGGQADGPNLMSVILRQLSIRGFLSTITFSELIPQFERDVAAWLREGKVSNLTTIINGMENAHEAINNLVSGQIVGKQLLQFSEDPTRS
ncbi:MAG: NADP-dependent oxidoreductase [Caenibius sp.]